MERHVFLLFLSTLHLDADSGDGLSHASMQLSDGTILDCVQTNVAAFGEIVQDLHQKGQILHHVFAFASKAAREEILLPNGRKDTAWNCFQHYARELATELQEKNFEVCAYSEDTDTEAGMNEIASMAESIRDYQWRHPNDRILLHADMTGGFRHTALMMLAVMQFLQYGGAEIGRVVYANYKPKTKSGTVENVSNIHRLVFRHPFINHTNHLSTCWSSEQRKAAESYGDIIDIPFPSIEPDWTEEKIQTEASKSAETIFSLHPSAVLCQGEYTYTFALIHQLQKHKIPVLAACSERMVSEEIDEYGVSHRVSQFQFIKFRQYK